ncbi:hypothetical protein JCM15831A_05280 [Asaia astilbis]
MAEQATADEQRWILGPDFMRGRPALILDFGEPGSGHQGGGQIAYRRKNGKWFEHGWSVNFDQFELVARPKESAVLNRFEAWKKIDRRRSIQLKRTKKCFISIQSASDTSTSDPDTPVMYVDLPLSVSGLGAYIREALSKTSDYSSRRINGSFPDGYLDEIRRRSAENSMVVYDELFRKHKLERMKLASIRSQLHIDQLAGCYRIHPCVSYRGSDAHVLLSDGDEQLGKVVSDLFDRPYMAEKKYCETYSYLSKIMPYLEQAIIEAEF